MNTLCESCRYFNILTHYQQLKIQIWEVNWAEWSRCGSSVLTQVCFEVFRCVKDTGRIVHVGLRCVEVRVSAEQFRNQRQHQRWVTGTQKLQTPERERKDKTVIRSSMDGFCKDKTQDRTRVFHSHCTFQLACLNILFLHSGLHKNYRTEQISLDGWQISAQNRPNWLLVLIQINKRPIQELFLTFFKIVRSDVFYHLYSVFEAPQVSQHSLWEP